MLRFSSDRERRLWAWAAAAVVAIYVTIGFSGPLLGLVPDDQRAAFFFLLAMFLVGMAALAEGLKFRPRGWEIGIALGIVAVYVMFFLRMTLAERTHLIEYGVVGILIHQALLERASQGRRVTKPALLAVMVATSIGIIDECIQFFVPNRVFDPVDIFFNFMAAGAAVTACVLLGWVRGRFGRNNQDRE